QLWAPAMTDPEGKYFATPAVNLVVAGAEAVTMAAEEGWPARFARHRRLARAARAGFAALELWPAAAAEALAPTLTALRLPAGVDGAALRREVLARRVLIAGGLGPWAASTIRIGHMGNIGLPELVATVAALEGALPAAGGPARPGAGVAALTAAFEAPPA
ncbi:MAG TPA: alanine--glyoxylate aminotransferase family protein, partial [Candidatus Dormibacteraeota bacterium]|nr:alanine--glyoxylate aminotransferase family protein [Candidatus Dormibacteraeota bacterium]